EPPRPRLSAGADAAELARALGAPAPLEPIRLSGVTLDSRSVETGDLWCALPGANAHGAQFAAQARERGAALALTDAAGRPLCERAGLPALWWPTPAGTPQPPPPWSTGTRGGGSPRSGSPAPTARPR